MGGFSLWHWIIVALVVLVLFGRGRISEVMGDFGKGISSFKKGMSEAEKDVDIKPAKQIQAQQAAAPGEGPAAPARTPEEETAAQRDPGG
ncbi:MAG TPA: twin-arginine translocase TatA/TatE family subunit [Croceibacterium sp.]|nr:twin-arginine translocase TatA/TatE family subunit [Croceibacterium sp.]